MPTNNTRSAEAEREINRRKEGYLRFERTRTGTRARSARGAAR